MKKFVAIVLALSLVLCLGISAAAADTASVTVINGMDGSEVGTYDAEGGELVIVISCAAPCDMGPVADGEEGSGVETTVGEIAYSDITTGGPNAYPTAETVTITGIDADAVVTITPNPDETDAEFPALTINGESVAVASASGEASAEASGEASAEASGEADGDALPMWDEYLDYLYGELMQDSFWQGNEASLTEALDAATSPDDESIQNFTGSGDVDQAPSGVEFPMVYADWYAAQ